MHNVACAATNWDRAHRFCVGFARDRLGHGLFCALTHECFHSQQRIDRDMFTLQYVTLSLGTDRNLLIFSLF